MPGSQITELKAFSTVRSNMQPRDYFSDPRTRINVGPN